MAKKYISKIVKGGNTIFVKDSEAQEDIQQLQNAFQIATENDVRNIVRNYTSDN